MAKKKKAQMKIVVKRTTTKKNMTGRKGKPSLHGFLGFKAPGASKPSPTKAVAAVAPVAVASGGGSSISGAMGQLQTAYGTAYGNLVKDTEQLDQVRNENLVAEARLLQIRRILS